HLGRSKLRAYPRGRERERARPVVLCEGIDLLGDHLADRRRVLLGNSVGPRRGRHREKKREDDYSHHGLIIVYLLRAGTSPRVSICRSTSAKAWSAGKRATPSRPR